MLLQPVVLEEAQCHQGPPGLVPLREGMRLPGQAVQPVAQHAVEPLDVDRVGLLGHHPEAVLHRDLDDPPVLTPLELIWRAQQHLDALTKGS